MTCNVCIVDAHSRNLFNEQFTASEQTANPQCFMNWVNYFDSVWPDRILKIAI